jgi:hypothetical protein
MQSDHFKKTIKVAATQESSKELSMVQRVRSGIKSPHFIWKYRHVWVIIRCMLKKLLTLVVSFSLSTFAVADIASDIASGVKVQPTTQKAKNDDIVQETTVEELILAGVPCVIAVESVRNVYSLTTLETDSIITIALNVEAVCEDGLSECENVARICPTLPLLALYSNGSGLEQAVGSAGTQGIGDTGSSGGGPCPGETRCSVSPN